MEADKRSFTFLYIMQVLAKGFSVFYFVLLTVFFAEGMISSEQLGTIGAVFIGLLIVGAVFVARWMHHLETRTLLQLAAVVSVGASAVLFIAAQGRSLPLMVASYAVMGLSVGIAMSGVNAMAAALTRKGDRYKSMAKLSMFTDVARMVFPLLVAATVAVGASNGAVLLIVAAAAVFLGFTFRLPRVSSSEQQEPAAAPEASDITSNRSFLYVLALEFFDSFSSSQLFVFLPLLFLAKGFSLENSLILQSFIFIGYLSGRWFVTSLCRRYSPVRAIAYTEIGMVVCIAALLTTTTLQVLYLLTFTLGIFSRGTSPAIKALAFDTLADHQMKKGSALHVVGGDSGSALGQLIFGFLVAAYGVQTPFVVATVIAGAIAVACLIDPVDLSTSPVPRVLFTILFSGRPVRSNVLFGAVLEPAAPGPDPHQPVPALRTGQHPTVPVPQPPAADPRAAGDTRPPDDLPEPRTEPVATTPPVQPRPYAGPAARPPRDGAPGVVVPRAQPLPAPPPPPPQRALPSRSPGSPPRVPPSGFRWRPPGVPRPPAAPRRSVPLPARTTSR
jgi:FSR family fosmidomycin resistance protein-like MFS transporter